MRQPQNPSHFTAVQVTPDGFEPRRAKQRLPGIMLNKQHTLPKPSFQINRHADDIK
jgi:hypothetical protein